MKRQLDITRDVCPMTTVKVGMAMAKLEFSEGLRVLLREAALRNVIASLKADGHRIEAVGREEEYFVLLVEKAGASAVESAPGARTRTTDESNTPVRT